MVDVATGMVVLAGSEVSKDAIRRMLGPTADYLGSGMQALAERASGNVQAVFTKATRKLGPQLDGDGAVPPKVLKNVVSEAAVAEDELVQDYLAGVLASSRSVNGRDDRAAAHARLVGDLSTYALRTHYLIYAAAQRLAVGGSADDIRVGTSQEFVYIPLDQWMAGMAFSEAELVLLGPVLIETLHMLNRCGLISSFSSGSESNLRSSMGPRKYGAPGMVVELTQYGRIFFCAASGISGDYAVAWVGDPGQFALEVGPSLPVAQRRDDIAAWVEEDSAQ